MFFPFVGLALAVVWSLRLMAPVVLPAAVLKHAPIAAAIALILTAEAAGTRQRNNVWRTEQSLWHDVTIKSPRNGRGLMNYGSALLDNHDYNNALDYLKRAAAYIPNDWVLQTNIAAAENGLNHEAEAEAGYLRAIAVAPQMADPYFFYARWLKSKGRLADSQAQLQISIRLNRLSFPARYELMGIYAALKNQPALDALVDETLRLAYNDETARRYRAERAQRAQAAPPPRPAAEALVRASTEACRAQRYQECLDKAKEALQLRPDYAEAYNVMAMALFASQRGEEGIQALREALRLKPDYETAKRNLAWALEQKRQAEAAGH